MLSQRLTSMMVALLLSLFAISALAQNGENADEKAIKEVIAQCAQALQNQDWEMLQSVTTKDWHHFTHMGTRWDMAAVKDFFSTHVSDHTIDFSEVEVHVSGDASMAWATFSEKTKFKFDGNPMEQEAIFTAIFEKEGDAWKMRLLHRSAVMPPPDVE